MIENAFKHKKLKHSLSLLWLSLVSFVVLSAFLEPSPQTLTFDTSTVHEALCFNGKWERSKSKKSYDNFFLSLTSTNNQNPSQDKKSDSYFSIHIKSPSLQSHIYKSQIQTLTPLLRPSLRGPPYLSLS